MKTFKILVLFILAVRDIALLAVENNAQILLNKNIDKIRHFGKTFLKVKTWERISGYLF